MFGFLGSSEAEVVPGSEAVVAGPATCLAMLHLLVSVHNPWFPAVLQGQRTYSALQLPCQTAAVHLLCPGTNSVLASRPLHQCEFSCMLVHLKVLTSPSATLTVCITLLSPIQTILFCDAHEACWQHVVQAYIVQQLKISAPGHGLWLQLLIASHQKSHRQQLNHSADTGHPYL